MFYPGVVPPAVGSISSAPRTSSWAFTFCPSGTLLLAGSWRLVASSLCTPPPPPPPCFDKWFLAKDLTLSSPVFPIFEIQHIVISILKSEYLAFRKSFRSHFAWFCAQPPAPFDNTNPVGLRKRTPLLRGTRCWKFVDNHQPMKYIRKKFGDS